MSNDIIPTNLTVPAHLANRVGSASSLGAAMSGGISDGVIIPRISLKGARFRIKEGKSEVVLPDHKLRAIIVGANPKLSKSYYAKTWKPDDEPAKPDCFSTMGDAPDAEAENPQSQSCATCPHAVWGSKITENGQKTKACSDFKRLAVVAADDPSGTIYMLQVTPAALRGLNDYHKELSMRGIPAEVVVTELSFDPDASFPKLQFAFGGWIDAPTQAVVDTLFGSAAVLEVTGENIKAAPPPLEVAKPVLVTYTPSSPPPPTPLQAAPATQPSQQVAYPASLVTQQEPTTEKQKDEPPKRGFGAAKAIEPTEVTPPRKAAAEPKPAQAASSKLLGDINDMLKDMDTDD